MRLWSIHPSYLDAKGLTALWREGLAAQAVLRDGKKGYSRHPQLARFRAHPTPLAAVATYLRGVWEEAERRGYRFKKDLVSPERTDIRLPVTEGQMRYEFDWLMRKLATRDAVRARGLATVAEPEPHPFFFMIAGGVEPWEKTRPDLSPMSTGHHDRAGSMTSSAGARRL